MTTAAEVIAPPSNPATNRTVLLSGVPRDTAVCAVCRRHEFRAGFHPIQVLSRVAIAVRGGNPGEVQQVRGSQRRDQLLSRSSGLQVELVPRDPVCSLALAGAAHPVKLKAMPNQRRRAVASEEARAARGENGCHPRRIRHYQRVRLTDGDSDAHVVDQRSLTIEPERPTSLITFNHNVCPLQYLTDLGLYGQSLPAMAHQHRIGRAPALL
jgi:hypothetical protein